MFPTPPKVRLIFLMVLVVLASASFASGGDEMWFGVEVKDVVSPHELGAPLVVSDGNGGAIVVFTHASDLNPPTYTGQIEAVRVDHTGTILWNVAVSTRTISDLPAITSDGAGGLIVAWMEGRIDGINAYKIYAQRVDANGIRQWGDLGVQVSTDIANAFSSQPVHMWPSIAEDGIGGAFIGWGGRAAQINSSGVLTAPGIDGIEVIPGSNASTSTFKMLYDGTGGFIPFPPPHELVPGGFFAAWSDTAGRLFAQWVNAGLNWGPSGTQVVQHDIVSGIDLAQDESGGLLIGWVGTTTGIPSRTQVRGQRLDSNGNPLWSPATGVIVIDSNVTGGAVSSSAISSDSGGGLIVSWLDSRNFATAVEDLYAQRLNASGFAQWTGDGVLLPPYIVSGTAPGSQGAPRVISDLQGGALVSYQDKGGFSWDIATTRLNANGNKLFSRWTFRDGTSSADPGLDQVWPDIDYDFSGPAPKGAVVAWLERESPHDRIYVDKVEIDAATATE